MSAAKQPPHASEVRENLLPIILCGLTIPASIMLWVFNVIFSKMAQGTVKLGENSLYHIYIYFH